jgi:hypothetical protein
VWGTRNIYEFEKLGRDKDYEGFVHFIEFNAGYRFDIKPAEKKGFYIIPQAGYLRGMNREEIIGPRDGKPDYFFTGKLLVGYRF